MTATIVTPEGVSIQLRRRGTTVQERRDTAPPDLDGPEVIRRWTNWRTVQRCHTRSSADAVIASRKAHAGRRGEWGLVT